MDLRLDEQMDTIQERQQPIHCKTQVYEGIGPISPIVYLASNDSCNLAHFVKMSSDYHGFHIWIGTMSFNSVLLQNLPEFTLHPHVTRYVFLLPAILLTEEAFLAGR